MTRPAILPLAAGATAALIGAALTLTGAAQQAGTVERIKVHGQALEGNLEGDSPDRDVVVYLPASYKTDAKRRYPVVYMLHGFTDDIDHWWGYVRHFVNVPVSMDKAVQSGVAREMILVMPNAYTRYQGSMYSNSVTTGNWEDFVTTDLVAYIDSHYRTIPNVGARGLVGHSMGGYGAIRLGMRHPEVYATVYVMSACCMTPTTSVNAERGRLAETLRTPDDVNRADFGTKVLFASAAAWSPNPNGPPFYLDLPTRDGQLRADVAAKWTANAPLAMVDQYVGNLKRLRALAIDVGTKDGLAPASKTLDEILTAYRIPHTYETYDGDHINHVADRLETKVFKFFSDNLRFER